MESGFPRYVTEPSPKGATPGAPKPTRPPHRRPWAPGQKVLNKVSRPSGSHNGTGRQKDVLGGAWKRGELLPVAEEEREVSHEAHGGSELLRETRERSKVLREA
ncbi:hypothetical protein AMELA_G00184960 [Ameiurus melas]|uniref:RNase H type-2 domain-containing protein n=1 Tax=Ameiurus melas TaxID=219545 RepID=A0A7J6A9N9_AMEME|nr:hypothetical protein AMELA_G00184960 [Ameiurus melas]